MKQLFLVLLIVGLIRATFIYFPVSTEYKNEPQGFRGIGWGSSSASIPNMVTKSIESLPPSYKNGKRNSEDLVLNGVLVKGINYDFNNDRFSAVVATFNSNDFEKMKANLIAQYGRGTHHGDKYEWLGETTSILLSKNPDYTTQTSTYGFIQYTGQYEAKTHPSLD